MVGLSAYFGEPIVDWNPLTAEYLGGLEVKTFGRHGEIMVKSWLKHGEMMVQSWLNG